MLPLNGLNIVFVAWTNCKQYHTKVINMSFLLSVVCYVLCVFYLHLV